ncbi:Amidase domain-containing protein [Bordetella sputigena]|uniref:amidase n=1 Tax=Bordetella sputigena TaxID=1416810 RepID=UPI0039F003C5
MTQANIAPAQAAGAATTGGKPGPSDPANPSGAFAPEGRFDLPGAATGPLARLRVGVKDMIDVQGRITGTGNPDWRATHGPAGQHAPVVRQLLDAGADVIGKTLTDELAYSLNGENFHYGTPVNPVTPQRIPGGSSCGSAVAAASGLCDIGLGTDTAGSIRLPATFCGAWGFRPTHGAVSSAGVVPLAPSYDVVGWITRDAATLARVGQTLLPPAGRAASQGDRERPEAAVAISGRLLIADDAWSLASDDVRQGLAAPLDRAKGRFGQVEHVTLAAEGLLAWQQVFRVIQGREVWAAHGEWISRHAPRFGPDIAERFKWASTIAADEADAAAVQRRRIAARLDDLLQDAVLCIPTVSFVAPVKGSTTAAEDRTRALCLLCIASLAGLPQLTMPAMAGNQCAVGLSLIAARGHDQALLDSAAHWAS